VPSKRLKGKEYFQLIDEFMDAVRFRWPKVLVQFEDFNSSVAQKLLDKYRDKHLCFNDDIQGTGATALAGLLCALRAKGEAVTALGDQKILIVGAGSAGIGIAQLLKQAMHEQGKTEEEAKDKFFVVDQHGLLGLARASELNPEQLKFARPNDDRLSLVDVIHKYRPTVIIGVTAVGGLFTEEVVRAMAACNDRPIVFPLSNPTAKAECTAEEAYRWTDGRCIFASGSPFAPVTLGDGSTAYPSQCNNMYIFPGLGLGATVCDATKVTDRMLYIAAETLAKFVPEDDVAKGILFPPLSRIREVSRSIAVAVAQEAIRGGLATRKAAIEAKDLDSFVAPKMYYPEYVPLVER
jgi:malate dehydrogenase (oxaloacetate-decarboxylating)(NADP+)